MSADPRRVVDDGNPTADPRRVVDDGNPTGAACEHGYAVAECYVCSVTARLAIPADRGPSGTGGGNPTGAATGLCEFCGLRVECFSYEGVAFLKDHRVISDPSMPWCEGSGTPRG